MENSSVDEIFRLIRDGNVASIQSHLENNEKVQINSTRWSGFSLLHRAAGLGHTDICEILILHGAEINLRSIRGWYTPLHIALSNGYIDTALFLIENGANPWTKSKYHEDPFEYGIKRGFKRLVEEFRSKVVKIEMTENLKRHKELLGKQKQPKVEDVVKINAENETNSS